MIVQPASLGPRRRSRRALRVVGLVVPVVVLAGVVTAGVLGPRPAPTPVTPTASAAAVATPLSTGAAEPQTQGEPATAVFPSSLAGLDVHGVRWTVEARNRGLARGVVAVAGYLGLDEIPALCRDRVLGVFGAFCWRVAVLGQQPWYGATHNAPDAPGFHLHPQFPPAVRVPSQASFVALSPSTATPAVILLARFSDSRAEECIPYGRHCGQELVVERVAWVDGTEYPRTATVDPDAETPERTGAAVRRDQALAAATLPAGGYPLLTALVDPGMIGEVEPTAAAAATELSDPVWLVRGLHARGDPSRIDWRIVTADGREILADGSVETESFAATDADG